MIIWAGVEIRAREDMESRKRGLETKLLPQCLKRKGGRRGGLRTCFVGVVRQVFGVKAEGEQQHGGRK